MKNHTQIDSKASSWLRRIQRKFLIFTRASASQLSKMDASAFSVQKNVARNCQKSNFGSICGGAVFSIEAVAKLRGTVERSDGARRFNRFAIASIFCTLFSLPLFSAPVGNTAAPELIREGFFIPSSFWASVRFGYEGDFVSDARLKQTVESSGRVDNYAQTTNSGTFTFNLLNRVDLYSVFGSSRASSEWRFQNSLGVVHNAEMETFSEFLWGVGARGIVLRWNQCDIGFGGRYTENQNQPSWLTIDGVNASVDETKLTWTEWQINADISYHIDLFTPYIGAKYSDLKAKLKGFSVPISDTGAGANTFRNRMPVGVYLGCGLSTGKYFVLNIEARLVDEEAVSVMGELRF